MKVTKKQGVTAIVAMSLAVPAPVFAQESSGQGYNPPETFELENGNGTGTNSNSTGDPKDPKASDPNLPFTGLDLGLLAAAGAGLVGLGLGMRRLTRRPDTA